MQNVIKTETIIADAPDGEAFPVTLSLLRREGSPSVADRLHIEFPEGAPQSFADNPEGVPCDFYLSAHRLQRFLCEESES